MKYGLCTLALFLIAGAAYAMTDYVMPHTWRYKITIEIETSEGIKSGSAVREVRAWRNAATWINPDIRDITYEVIGEAVVIDLGECGYLFSLVGSEDQVQNAFFNEKRLTLENVLKINSLKNGQKAKLFNIDTFINFENTNDPQSIRTLDAKTLSKICNKETVLKNVIIEITNEPVTRGQIRNILKWIDAERIGLGGWDPSQTDQAKYLTKESFIKDKGEK